MNESARMLLALAAAGLAGVAGAQTAWRCGDSYSQQPCPGGREVPIEDARTPAQRAQTAEAARRDAKLADDMEKARLKEEAKPASVSIPPAKARPAVAEAAREGGDRTDSSARVKKPAYFSAVSPKKPGPATVQKTAVQKKKKKSKKPAA